jgi:flagellin
LQQLSSGQRINSGADDPAGLAVADGLAANQAALTQSSANATDGVGFLQTADGALAQVTNLLDSAVSIATEAANGTLTSGQVSSANQEYQNILTEVGDIGSTTNFNSISVFSSSATNFFVSDGSSTGVNNYQDTVGALTTASVGTSAPAGATSVAITNPTPTTATTAAGATATISLAASTDNISGTLSVAVAGGSAVSVNLGSTGVTLTSAASTLNATTAFAAAGLTATVGIGSNANELIIKGPVDTVTAGTGSSITNPSPTASTTTAGSTATLTLGSASDTISGSLSVAVGRASVRQWAVAAMPMYSRSPDQRAHRTRSAPPALH